MTFRNFLDLMDISEETYFVKKDGVLKAASIIGTKVITAIGTYRGEEMERLPDEILIKASKLKEIWDYIANNMSITLEDNVLELEGKNKKLSFRLKDAKGNKIPTPKKEMGTVFINLKKEDIDTILDYKKFTDGVNVTFFAENKTCDIIVKSAIPGNEAMIQCDILRKLETPFKFSYPKDFFDLLRKVNDNKFTVDIYFAEEIPGSPLKIVIKEEKGEVEYFLAQRLVEEE